MNIALDQEYLETGTERDRQTDRQTDTETTRKRKCIERGSEAKKKT